MPDKGRLYLHIGLPKTGTTFLQARLAENRPRLREAGFIYPFVRREGMFHGAADVRDDHARWGLDPALIDGTWPALLEKARAFEGTAIISHELLAGADAAQIDRAAEQLGAFDLHLVVTARDLARQIPAHWQEAVKNGETYSFSDYLREVRREQGAPDTRLWEEQDLLAVLDRWSVIAPPDRVHVVTCPPSGADPDELWRRFAGATGLPAELPAPELDGANESLGAAEVHLLRRVNEQLAGRIPQPAYAHVVKRLFAQRVLSRHGSPRVETPEELRELLGALAAGWVQSIRLRGYPVHGNLDDLVPTRFGRADPDALEPRDFPEVPMVVAAILEEVVGLRAARAPAELDEDEVEPRRRFGRRRR